PVAEELPPRFSPFACRGRYRRLRFSCLKEKYLIALENKFTGNLLTYVEFLLQIWIPHGL
ncbi:hypothetical protein, partial [uncultured Psychrobacillus sp.]|uniref:hypothetical protein n=1 Tax=uncultured Psychrobacillus sp. TaxID=1551585 RepID=UPI002608DD26